MAIDPQTRDTILAQLGPEHAHLYPKLLEADYPHVLEKVARLSGPAEMDRFFENLLVTPRSDRTGFSAEVFSEILTLVRTYRKVGLLRAPAKRDDDIWNWSGERGADTNSPKIVRSFGN